jgi:hypothetical protein
VTILACRACGQRFLSVFFEQVDWVDSDDPQEWTVAPITPDEAAELAARNHTVDDGAFAAISAGRRCLRVSHPKGAGRSVFWSTEPPEGARRG